MAIEGEVRRGGLPGDIGVRYPALQGLADADAKELTTVERQALNKGQIAQVLANMENEGYCEKPVEG